VGEIVSGARFLVAGIGVAVLGCAAIAAATFSEWVATLIVVGAIALLTGTAAINVAAAPRDENRPGTRNAGAVTPPRRVLASDEDAVRA